MGKVLVLGITDHHISYLTEITDKATVDELRLQSPSSTLPGLERFFGFLKHSKPPATINDENTTDEEDISKFTQSAQQQIKKMEDLLLRRNKNDDLMKK